LRRCQSLSLSLSPSNGCGHLTPYCTAAGVLLLLLLLLLRVLLQQPSDLQQEEQKILAFLPPAGFPEIRTGVLHSAQLLFVPHSERPICARSDLKAIGKRTWKEARAGWMQRSLLVKAMSERTTGPPCAWDHTGQAPEHV